MDLDEIMAELEQLELGQLYERDFWDLSAKSELELAGVFAVADVLRELRERNYDLRVFHSGLALIAPGRFAQAMCAAAVMLGLTPVVSERFDLPGAMPDVIAPASDLSAERDRVFRLGLSRERPLAVDVSTGLPYILRLIHRFEGVPAIRGQALELPDYVPGDLMELGRRFGLTPGTELLPEDETLRAEGLRPYVLAAMVFLGKCPEPVKLLRELKRRGVPRRMI